MVVPGQLPYGDIGGHHTRTGHPVSVKGAEPMSLSVPTLSMGLVAAAAVVGLGLPASSTVTPAVTPSASTTVLAGCHHHHDDGDGDYRYDHNYYRYDHNYSRYDHNYYGDSGLIVLHDLL
jgi:hypothetical protein